MSPYRNAAEVEKPSKGELITIDVGTIQLTIITANKRFVLKIDGSGPENYEVQRSKTDNSYLSSLNNTEWLKYCKYGHASGYMKNVLNIAHKQGYIIINNDIVPWNHIEHMTFKEEKNEKTWNVLPPK
jgi:hypothetical protein